MIYLSLFLTFFEIGLFTFGGGYAMISLIRDKTLSLGWLTEGELLNMIAVSESTPGPIAVNMATFVGSSQAGILGALVATVGLVLPSFVIILLVASLIRNLIKFRGVQAALSGIKPVVIGLILATATTMFLSVVFSVTNIYGGFSFDLPALAILTLLVLTGILYKKTQKKVISPIVLILVSAVLGVIFY